MNRLIIIIIKFLHNLGLSIRWNTPYISQVKAYQVSNGKHNFTDILIQRLTSKGSGKQASLVSRGSFTGWEFKQGLNPEKLGRASTGKAVTWLNAGNVISGRFPFVFENASDGVVFHIVLNNTNNITTKDGELSSEIASNSSKAEGLTSQKPISYRGGFLHNLLHNSFSTFRNNGILTAMLPVA